MHALHHTLPKQAARFSRHGRDACWRSQNTVGAIMHEMTGDGYCASKKSAKNEGVQHNLSRGLVHGCKTLARAIDCQYRSKMRCNQSV
jgi:hypothetical protein